MTVFIDSREDIPVSGAIKVDGLEARTGADLMLSRLSAPCSTSTLLGRHIDADAILVQLKIGEDLAASVGDRLNDSLARMRSVTKRTASHWLLFVGSLDCDREGSALINGFRSRQAASYATISGALVGWIARGGVYYPLPRIEMLDGFCHSIERKLAEYEREQYKYVFSQQGMPDDLDTPLQIPVRVTDARRVLIGFRGLGPESVNKVWAYTGDLKSALMFLTNPENTGVIDGIGAKTIASIRRQCGLSDGDGPMLYETSAQEQIVKDVRARNAAMSETERKANAQHDTEVLFGKKGKAGA